MKGADIEIGQEYAARYMSYSKSKLGDLPPNVRRAVIIDKAPGRVIVRWVDYGFDTPAFYSRCTRHLG